MPYLGYAYIVLMIGSLAAVMILANRRSGWTLGGLLGLSAKAKVAHVLLTLDRQALLDRMTRQQLADLANLTLETTVRTISQFLREGTLKGSRFTLLSERGRLALAEMLEPYEPGELPYS